MNGTEGTQRLCKALYGREPVMDDWKGGANARMLHDTGEAMMIFYRYTGMAVDNDSEVVNIRLDEYMLFRETTHGYWIIHKYYRNYPESVKENRKRWISKTARKKSFAWSSKERAWEHFKYRTRMSAHLLEWRLRNTKLIMAKIERIESKEQNKIDK